MSQGTLESITNFLQALTLQGAAELTIRNYRSDLLSFARFSEGSTAEFFSPTVSPTVTVPARPLKRGPFGRGQVNSLAMCCSPELALLEHLRRAPPTRSRAMVTVL